MQKIGVLPVLEIIAGRRALHTLVAAVLDVFPDHSGYCRARFSDDAPDYLDRTETLAALVLAVAGPDLHDYARDYRWMCERFLEEEVHFARTGQYRLSTFQQALDSVYADPGYMARYVRGILLSQVLWAPHARAMDVFRTRFLPSLRSGADYLEIGPGHGLFLHFAAERENVASLRAWDVSAASIAETRHALAALGVSRPIALERRDLLEGQPTQAGFDAAVISEVLEHLERPDRALDALAAALRPGGRLFVNAPINSPAPDHIFLWRSPGEVEALVRAAGFTIDTVDLLPVTGVPLERALRKGMSVSCVIVAERRG